MYSSLVAWHCDKSEQLIISWAPRPWSWHQILWEDNFSQLIKCCLLIVNWVVVLLYSSQCILGRVDDNTVADCQLEKGDDAQSPLHFFVKCLFGVERSFLRSFRFYRYVTFQQLQQQLGQSSFPHWIQLPGGGRRWCCCCFMIWPTSPLLHIIFKAQFICPRMSDFLIRICF